MIRYRLIMQIIVVCFLAVLGVEAKQEAGEKPDFKAMDREALEAMCLDLVGQFRSLEAQVVDLKTSASMPLTISEPTISDTSVSDTNEDPAQTSEEVDALRRDIEMTTRAEIDRLAEKIAGYKEQYNKIKRAGQAAYVVDHMKDLRVRIADTRAEMQAYTKGGAFFIPNFSHEEGELRVGALGRAYPTNQVFSVKVADVLDDNVIVVNLYRSEPAMRSGSRGAAAKLATFLVKVESIIGLVPDQAIQMKGFYRVEEIRSYQNYQLHLLVPVDTDLVEQAQAAAAQNQK